MSLPYYKRFPRDFFEGTIGMGFEAKCAYGLVLDMIYMRDGRLPDDPRYISGMLGCSVRKWNSIRSELLDAGKLQCVDGMISNSRADNLCEERRTYQDKQAENRSRPNKNNKIETPSSPPKHHHTEPEEKKGANAPSAGASENIETVEAIWKLLPAKKRKLTSKSKLVRPLTKILKAGHSADRVIAAVARCYSEPRHKEDGGQFAPAAYSFLADGVWENYAPQVAADGADPDLSTWQNAMRLFVETGQWSSQVYGPKPGEPGCRVPDGLLNYWRKTQEIAA